MIVVGIGCDLVQISRIERLLRLYGDRFLRRAFHRSEIAQLQATRDAAAAAQFAAARWAVKESVYKAVAGQWRVQFNEVYIVRGERREPRLAFDGQTARRMLELGVERHFVSMSHERHYALANVVLCSK